MDLLSFPDYGNSENTSETTEEQYLIESDAGSDVVPAAAATTRRQTKLHLLRFDLIERQFQTQTSGPKHGEMTVTFDTIEEFRFEIWEQVKHLLKMEVITSNDTEPKFADSAPELADFDKFVMFAHPTKKAARAPSSLDQINHWKNKLMRLYVHPYSISLASKRVFEKVSKSLLEPYERDRAGACTNAHIESILEKLKEIHGDRYTGFEINWRLWATFISNSETHLQENLMNDPPPPEIIINLPSRYNTSDQILASNFQNLTVGTHINDDIRMELNTMKPVLDRIMDNMERNTADFKEFYNRFLRLCAATETRHGLLQSVPRQQPPTEMASSASLIENIDDCGDVDHQNIQ